MSTYGTDNGTGYGSVFNSLGINREDVRKALNDEKQQQHRANLISNLPMAEPTVGQNVVDLGAYRMAAAQAMSQRDAATRAQQAEQNSERSYSFNPRPPFGRKAEVKKDHQQDLAPKPGFSNNDPTFIPRGPSR